MIGKFHFDITFYISLNKRYQVEQVSFVQSIYIQSESIEVSFNF